MDNKNHVKQHLEMVHPFLRKGFRPLKRTELKTKKVFVELFGEGPKFEAYKLRAIFEHQKQG